MGEARIPCPLCGQPIHPIAGRCKHCKGNLAAVRAHAAPARAALPYLQRPPAPAPAPAPQASPYAPAAPPAPGAPPPQPQAARPPIVPRPHTPVVLPDSPPLKPTWPIAVVIIAVAAVLVSVMVVAFNRSKSPSYRLSEAEDDSEDALERFAEEQARLAEERERAKARRTIPAPPAPSRDDVRAPVASDLGDYTANITGSGLLKAKIDTSLGTITCVLFDDRAPMTVANFVGLATGKKPWLDSSGQIQKGKPFYDGLTFHRVIQDFMIQGGDPQGTGTGGPGYQFANEIDSSLSMEAGTLAMANAGPNTNGSQFFITEKATAWLDGKHTIFGHCSDLNVVGRIARVPRSSSDQPFDPITMTVTILRE
jgi:cyclophilin family peptidyl-prolyl cis-trans isomerase